MFDVCSLSYVGILVVGGTSARNTAEVFQVNGNACTFPSLPHNRYHNNYFDKDNCYSDNDINERYHGTLNNLKYCGGGDNMQSQKSCLEFKEV